MAVSPHTHFEVNKGVFAPNYSPTLLLVLDSGDRMFVQQNLQIPEDWNGLAWLWELKLPASNTTYTENNINTISSEQASKSFRVQCKQGIVYQIDGTQVFTYQTPYVRGRNTFRPWAGNSISLATVDEGMNFSDNPFSAIEHAWNSL